MTATLSPVETRILGCLIEKERTTPENYPLSLHAVTAASNQTTNRDPVTNFDEKTVAAGLDDLRAKKLATAVWGAGSRVQKFRHNLLDVYDLSAPEIAVLCVLLLRGPQTPGELRARAERMSAFANTAAVEQCLAELGRGDSPLVRMLPQRPGQKENRFAQLLSGEPEEIEPAVSLAPLPTPSPRPDFPAEIAELRAELAALREEFAAFRKQFEQ